MASTPVARPKSSAGAALVILLIIAALALSHSGGHSGGGAGTTVPSIVGATGDPCHGKPDDHVAATIQAPGRSRRGQLTLDCGQWRNIARRQNRAGGGRGTIAQIIRCLTATVNRGNLIPRGETEAYSWRWGTSRDDVAVVIANAATGRISQVAPGYGTDAAWRQCAAAARV